MKGALLKGHVTIEDPEVLIDVHKLLNIIIMWTIRDCWKIVVHSYRCERTVTIHDFILRTNGALAGIYTRSLEMLPLSRVSRVNAGLIYYQMALGIWKLRNVSVLLPGF